MEIVVPIPVTLAVNGSPSVYYYSAWSSGVYYASGTIRRYGAASRDYLCTVSHTSSSSNAPGTSITTTTTTSLTGWAALWAYLNGLPITTTVVTSSGGYWKDLGPSSVTSGYGLNCNVRASDYATWTSGNAVGLNEARYDSSDNRDYLANVAISAGENTLRPSECAFSSDETIAARWSAMGSANASSPFDYQINTKCSSYDGNGAVVDLYEEINLAPNGVNLVGDPNDFTTWGTSNCSITANQYMDVYDNTPTASVDKITKTSSTGNSAWIYKAFAGLVPNAKFTFSVYLQSSSVSQVSIVVQNGAGTAQSTITVCSPLTNTLAYFRVDGFVDSAGEAVIVIVFNSSSASGVSFGAWGACAAYTGPTIDRVCFTGLENSKEIGIRLARRYSAALHNQHSVVWYSANTQPAEPSYGTDITSAVIEITPRAVEPGDLLAYVVYRRNKGMPSKLGAVIIGKALRLGITDYGLELNMLSFSRKERDDTFGTVKLIKRGTAKQCKATLFVDPQVTTGDVLQNLFSQYDGQPLWFDFNDGTSNYDRLRIFGFWTSVSPVIQALTWETFQCTIEGLVE